MFSTVEPLPSDAALRKIPGSIYSPHIAGPTRDMLPELGRRALHNVKLFLAGQRPESLITPEVYDRST